tara:strand:+ start:495 stop:752 length:258 start_codon:yes stop_codon:yes gene_type:complete
MAMELLIKRTPRTPSPTNFARQLTRAVDIFDPDEPWVNVPGFHENRMSTKHVWAPVRKMKYTSLSMCKPLTVGQLDPLFEEVEDV